MTDADTPSTEGSADQNTTGSTPGPVSTLPLRELRTGGMISPSEEKSKDKSNIEVQFDTFEAVLDNVNEIVTDLIKAIGPILGPSRSGDIKTAAGEEQPDMSDIAARLQVNTSHLGDLRDRISAVMPRIEL